MRKTGFTLIELVVVIVILGVLAAFAIPRFVGLQGEARAATLQGMLGAMRSAAALAHSQSRTQELGSTDPITMEGVSVSMFYRFPDAPGMLDAANIDVGNEFTVQMFGINAFTITAAGATSWAECGVAYVRAIPPGIQTPLFLGPNTVGC